ncbi:RidA family protein [Sinorhizobium meliloti]|uniref:RidA family protein n=1 Tax=Rhizobium meliloti TaxID=382 RepID=UPI00030D8E17|nr:RidA family protein [Sinorhizobium meliloti]MDE4604518.1 RidA family protein [Sinorhizobium meliloti]MQU95025.1 RidA family protein [Sinorhizobium meliloti]MQW59434.1 RidA family protein [Sinorhizobium meliloti]MQW61734.1 RidA family protein [Sinorhizobium meliloti]
MKVERLDVNARRSRLVKYNGVCYLSGQFSDDAGDVATQTRETLAKIDELLARAGTDKSRLLTAEVWITSMADFATMDAVWKEWVAPGDPPTRCCCAVELGDPDMRVEIMVTAAFGDAELTSL